MNKTIKFAFLAILFLIASSLAYAQITTSALGGRVVDKDGQAVVGVAVVATHTPSGTIYGAVTNNDGRYTIQGMRTGGPYSVEISSLGYQTVTYKDVILQLGELYSLNAVIKDDAEKLSEAVVVASPSSKFAAEKTGASTNISSSQISQIPTVNRSISDVARLSPYGGNGMSFAGADGRTANFTVDGANFNNNFGLSEALPGGGNPISIDAIEEIQVVISPYDIRQNNFIGGGVNAITKSGTNQFRGTAYAYYRNELMRGDVIYDKAVAGARDKDRNTTYGFTFGGPIIKNKLFFFVNYEQSIIPTVANRWRPSKNGKADPDAFISRTTEDDMNKVYDFLKTKYGYDAGSFTDYPANESNRKILARLDWNINRNHKLALRYNYTLNRSWRSPNASSSNATMRTTEGRLSQYSMAFSNTMYSMDNKVNTLSFDLNSRFGDHISNQLLVTMSQLDDIRGTNSSKFPFIDILDGTGVKPYMSVGYELFTWNNGVHNQVVTAKDDVTMFFGDHKLTGGISYEYQMADNAYMRNGTGYYRYNSLDDFFNGAAPETVALTYGYDGNKNPAARVRYNKLALYAQDEWNVNEKFKLTGGLRLETIIFNNKDLKTNKMILNDYKYNGVSIDTGKWPSTKLQISPRIGFNWDVFGDRSLKIRGGSGLFTGRLPLVFFTNMPTNSGMVQNVTSISTKYEGGVANPDPLLEKLAGGMITNVEDLLDKLYGLDPSRFPKASPEAGVKPSSISAIDPKFQMPQVWKTSIAADYAIPTPFPFNVTGEFIFNKTVNAVCVKDLNMKPVEGFARLNGADNRHIFPADYKYSKTSAYMLSNTNLGYGYSASISFNMQPAKGLDINGAYTHTVSKELTGMPGSDAASAFTYVSTTEGPNNPVLHNSQYVTPDRAYLSLSYHDRADNHFGIFYEAWRGGFNYSYMYANDLNGDNYNYDAIYIPKDDTEIRFASKDDADRYWAFAAKDKYLSSHKGQYAEAYSLYSPWVHRVDFRYAHDFKIRIGKTVNVLQLNFDLKNALNIFSSKLGVSKQLNPLLDNGRILEVKKIDPDGAPVFTTPKNVNGNTEIWTPVHSIGQCWYAQIGIKYMFN